MFKAKCGLQCEVLKYTLKHFGFDALWLFVFHQFDKTHINRSADESHHSLVPKLLTDLVIKLLYIKFRTYLQDVNNY